MDIEEVGVQDAYVEGDQEEEQRPQEGEEGAANDNENAPGSGNSVPLPMLPKRYLSNLVSMMATGDENNTSGALISGEFHKGISRAVGVYMLYLLTISKEVASEDRKGSKGIKGSDVIKALEETGWEDFAARLKEREKNRPAPLQKRPLGSAKGADHEKTQPNKEMAFD